MIQLIAKKVPEFSVALKLCAYFWMENTLICHKITIHAASTFFHYRILIMFIFTLNFVDISNRIQMNKIKLFILTGSIRLYSNVLYVC